MAAASQLPLLLLLLPDACARQCSLVARGLDAATRLEAVGALHCSPCGLLAANISLDRCCVLETDQQRRGVSTYAALLIPAAFATLVD